LKNTEYDILIIGAGPAGSVVAQSTAALGYSVLQIEKRPVIGAPVRCGEATGTRDRLKDFGPINEDTIETDIQGLILHANGGQTIRADLSNVGLMLDRLKFDPYYAELGVKAGVELLTSARATDVSAVQNGFRTVSIVYQDTEHKIRARIVVGADGVETLASRWVGLKTRQLPPFICSAIELKLNLVDKDPEHLIFWHGHDYINDGYIWSFPKKKSQCTNFGAGFITPKLGAPNIREVADQWREKIYPGSVVEEVGGGVVPVSAMLEEYVSDHFLAVGDAAHHTNPMTGGGIASGMRAGLLAAAKIDAAFKSGDFSKGFLKQYQQDCLNTFGNNHLRELKIRQFILSLPNKDQTYFYKMLKVFVEKGKFAAALRHPLGIAQYALRYRNFKV
jgi:digeranylgeranylglycerophospholipid reductase